MHPRAVDLRETIDEIAARSAPRLHAKRQRLDVQIAEPRPPALADPARMRQVITNLVTNAHLYTGEEGAIALRLDADARTTTITVADNGRGMAAQDARHVFDRFHRGSADDRKSPGTGLGLAIVKSLVELQGGTIGVASEPGRGSTFTVSLPSAAGAPSAAAGAPHTGLAARRVLVVDDEPALAQLIAQQLDPLGVRTVQVNSGAEALARLRAERFDAMTLDVLMPGMNGFDVLRAVRSDPRLRELPVIFVSVSSRSPQLAGEWAVAKPIDRGLLTDVLARGDPGAAIARARRRPRTGCAASSPRRSTGSASSTAGRRRPRAPRAPPPASSSRSRSCTRTWLTCASSSTEAPCGGAATAVRSSCSARMATGRLRRAGSGCRCSA